MTEIQQKLADLVQFSSSQNPSSFKQTFDSVMLSKVESAIQAQKINIARNMFSSETSNG